MSSQKGTALLLVHLQPRCLGHTLVTKQAHSNLTDVEGVSLHHMLIHTDLGPPAKPTIEHATIPEAQPGEAPPPPLMELAVDGYPLSDQWWHWIRNKVPNKCNALAC